MEPQSESLSPIDVQEIDARASVFMEEGLRWMADSRPEAIPAALQCFERALELRRRLPIEMSPMLRYGLAACWLNRADVLMRLNNSEQTELALHSYDEALDLLRSLPLDQDPRFSRRLAIAHQNRGLALQSQSSSASAEVLQELSKAIQILEHKYAAQIDDRLYLLAAVWLNLAAAELSEGSARCEKDAEKAARRAIALVENLENNEVHMAEVGIKARQVLCRAIANRLAQSSRPAARVPGAAHEATDAADEGLALARRWEQKGEVRFRTIAQDLFRFGARVYARYQPQFVAEFISENMDPSQSTPNYVESEEMRAAVREIDEWVLQELSSRSS